MVVDSIDDISVGRRAGSLRRKRRLIEMSGVDGAVVFDDERLLAVGALIRSHPDVGNQLGARATAARSAFLWGGRPIKVSSDGDVTIHFKSRNRVERVRSGDEFPVGRRKLDQQRRTRQTTPRKPMLLRPINAAKREGSGTADRSS